MPLTTGTQSVGLGNLGNLTLRLGDNDARHIWGGSAQSGIAGQPIAELQKALKAVGVLTEAADGAFGTHTQVALKRFQWYLSNSSYRLKVAPGASAGAGTISPYQTSSFPSSGACNAALASILLGWQRDNYITTTPLVRVSLNSASNIDTSNTFQVLHYLHAQDGEILLHADFADCVRCAMNDEAKRAKVRLSINQTFRCSDHPPSGAVVTPAKKSQHLVGHAVDLNIIDGNTTNTAAMFNSGTETDAADTFIEALKKNCKRLRWGGDFSDTDPVHFDDYLDPQSEAYAMTFFFVQHCFAAGHPMRLLS